MSIRTINHRSAELFFVADDMGQPVSFGYPTREQAEEVEQLIESSEGLATIPNGVDVEAAVGIESELDRIGAALGDTVATADQPCGTVAYYDAEAEKPWRISCDHASESFETAEDAIVGAREWAKSLAEA